MMGRSSSSIFPRLPAKLQTIKDVGLLGYDSLGQPATTLSGGEAQRMKLASELQALDWQVLLSWMSQPRVCILEDIAKLLHVITLCDGNTVLVIEHNLMLSRQLTISST